jgi:anti-sigma B factor antagonist
MTSDIVLEPAGDGIYVVRAAGELDLYTAPDLKAEILNAVEAGARGVVVDLTETTFIDSTALGVLLRGVQRLRPRGGRLLVVCPDANITKIFHITGLDRVFPIYETRDAALRQAALA